jgi:gamma-butyrobetaine dioxygenase
MTAQLAVVDVLRTTCLLTFDDGTQSTFHHLWLRDNAPELLHPTTHHRVVETSSIPDNVRPRRAVVDHGDLVITWDHDGHVSRYASPWLLARDYSNGVRRQRRRPVLWDASAWDAGVIPESTYKEVHEDDNARRGFMAGLRDYGLAFLHDVPTESGTVLDVAALFGEVRSTSWGRMFDVVSMADANSLAYTNLPLVTHTDEAYRDPAPTMQLQHFLQVDSEGGESTLVDGFRIAEDLRTQAPDQFALLASTFLHFHFQDDTTELEHDAPVLDVGPDGTLRAVRFSNHSAQPFLLPPDQIEPYYAAYRAFGRMRESDRYQLRIKMEPGDLYMVDNRRVLHGRTGFTGAGTRHLQGCYIERDEFLSRLTMLERAAGLVP